MMWLFLPGVFVLLAGYIICAPFYVNVNSDVGLFELRFHHLATVSLVFTDYSPLIKIRIAGFHKQMELIKTVKKEKVTVKKPRQKKFKKIPVSKLMAMVKSFQVNTCFLTIDTGNMQMNGILFPVFNLIGQRINKDISINFINENKFIFQMENNLARMMWAYIKS